MSEVVLSHVCRMPNRFFVCWWYRPHTPVTWGNADPWEGWAVSGPYLVRILVGVGRRRGGTWAV